MEELKKVSDLRLKRLESVVRRAKKDGKIDRKLLFENLRREFGTELGGEYFMDHTVLAGRHIGIPLLPQRSDAVVTARATIFAPKSRQNDVLSAAKYLAKKKNIPVAVSIGGKLDPRIPIQRMYLEIASEIHNRLIDRFGDRVRLTAVVGGTGTKNVATIPTKIKPDKTGRLRGLIGTFPDLDFFAAIDGITPEERKEIAKIARTVEQEIAPKYGFSENAYFVDVHRDYGIVDPRDVEGAAHSLHPLKPKIIIHGDKFYEALKNNPKFRKAAEEEAKRYMEKLRVLSSTIYAKTLSNVWRRIRLEREKIEQELASAKTGNNTKNVAELHARKLLADEMARALEDILDAHAPLGFNAHKLVMELESEKIDPKIRESTKKIYDYRAFGGKRMYLARKLANKDKETARLLTIVELAGNIAMERARRRAQEINSMRRDGQPRILQKHLFRAAKYLQRRILATAIEDLIRAKETTGKNARRDGYSHLPIMIKKYEPK